MIVVNNLSAQIKDEKLFYIDHFRFKKNTSYLLKGDNGTGKSSLLKAFIGEFPYIKGDIEINGDIVFQPQNPYLYQKTARDNFKLFSIDIDKYMDLFRDFNIEEMLDKNVDVLSGGQRQKIAFIRSIALGKEILLLDEPFSQMDNMSVYIALDEIVKWRESVDNRLLIIVSHDPLNENVFDQILEIKDYRLRILGDKNEI